MKIVKAAKRLTKKAIAYFKGSTKANTPTKNQLSYATFSAPFSPKMISPQAIKVVQTLQQKGFSAYVVGGSIRDLLLEQKPKDFDVATNAKPEEIRKIFPNCRLIGRRFRIAHILFRYEIVEVTTFRGVPDKTKNHTSHQVRSNEQGILITDNQYGTIEEDADRRDFTVNSFYYDPSTHTIIDFCAGVKDLKIRKLVMIGQPSIRLREDPVRMLRAARLSAKLDFAIDTQIETEIKLLKTLLYSVPPARLFDEAVKLFLMGYGEKTFTVLHQQGLLSTLYPETAESLQKVPQSMHLIQQALYNTDQRIHAHKKVTPAFLYAALLWQPMLHQFEQRKTIESLFPALYHAMSHTIAEQTKITAIPRVLALYIRDIWEIQIRFAQRAPKSLDFLLEHEHFRAAYDFLLLRAESGESEEARDLAEWWTQYQDAPAEKRREMQKEVKSPPKKNNQRRRNKRKKASPPPTEH
jgi:poly(A) polymerase